MVPYYGDFAEDATVRIPFNTFSSDDPAASVTITNLADGDIKVHKDGSTTQIVTDGATGVIDFDGVAGNHLVTIDTSAHADYTTGAEYTVRVEGVTVDGAQLNVWIGAFSIERVGGALAIAKLIQTAVIANAAGDDIAADLIAMKAETVLIVADTNELQVDDVPGLIAALNNLSAANVATELATYDGPTRSEATSDKDEIVTLLSTEIADILTDTGTTIPALIAALNNITAASVLAAGDADGFTLEESLKLLLAGLSKLSGAATVTNTFRAADDSKDRITATVDSDGNRTAVTLDAAG